MNDTNQIEINFNNDNFEELEKSSEIIWADEFNQLLKYSDFSEQSIKITRNSNKEDFIEVLVESQEVRAVVKSESGSNSENKNEICYKFIKTTNSNKEEVKTETRNDTEKITLSSAILTCSILILLLIIIRFIKIRIKKIQ